MFLKLGLGLGQTATDTNTLPGTAAYSAADIRPMAWFGQDSADELATDSADGTRRLTLPAGALLQAPGVDDWYLTLHFTTGPRAANSNYETLAARAGLSGAWVRLVERATASPANMHWRFQPSILSAGGSRDLLDGMTPAMTTQSTVELGASYCMVLGKVGLTPYFAIRRVGATTPHLSVSANSIASFNSFYFDVAQYTDGTVERAGNVLTYRKASIATTYQPGTVVLIQSVDQPSINGIYTIVSRLGSNAGFTVASVGADFGITAANASTRNVRTTTAGTSDIFKVVGALENASAGNEYGWAGAAGPVEMRYGSMPISGGLIDPVWLKNVTERRVPQSAMPGTLRYRSALSPADSYAADPAGVITGAATATGSPVSSSGIGADWLVFEPWDWHTPFAADMNPAGGSATGTVKLRFTSAYKTGSLYAEVRDSPTYGGGSLLLAEKKVSSGTPSGGGSGVIELSGIPVGQGRYLHIRSRTGLTMVWGPFAVGPTFGIVSQSTLNILFQSTTGIALAPVASASGIGTVGDVAGTLAAGLFDSGTNPTNRAGWCRLSRYPIGFNGSAGDGIKAFTNKLIELAAAEHGRAVPAAAYNLCRSGHPAGIYWADRRAMTNSIGTATAGVALTGTWQPQPLWVSSVTYAQPSTAKVYRGGTFAQIGDTNSEWRLTGGTLIATVDGSGNLVAVGGSGVTGTFNPDTCAFSVTDPVGGSLYIEATLFFDTPNSTTAGGRTGTGFTVWGQNNTYDTGHIDNLLSRMKRQTAFVWSWANYLLGFANINSQTAVNAQVAFDIAMIRQRIEDNYPEHAGTPWIVACDARTKSSSSIGEHRIRVAMREYALNTPNTYWSIGPITGDMDNTLNSPHPGNLASSGQLWGTTFAHGVAKACGIAGAKADEVYITSGTRGPAGAYVDLVFNVPVGANLTCSDPTKIEGLYFGTTDDTSAMSLVDVNGGTYSTQIIGGNTVRVTPTSGSFAATTWWNVHVGFVLTDAVFATENTRLTRTLSLDTGGYNSIRPGQPISFCPTNVLVQ